MTLRPVMVDNEGLLELRRAVRRANRPVRVGGVLSDNDDALVIPGGVGRGGQVNDFPFRSRVFRITAAVQQGANKQWLYTGKLMIKATAGYGGWGNDPKDTNDFTLYNDNEDQNGSTGTYGNGVDQDDIDLVGGTFDMVPIPIGTRVRAWPEVVSATRATEWWIDLPNGVTGACS